MSASFGFSLARGREVLQGPAGVAGLHLGLAAHLVEGDLLGAGKRARVDARQELADVAVAA